MKIAKSADEAQPLTYGRDLLWELVIRDIRLRYSATVLGVGWSLVNPLAHFLVLNLVFTRVLPLEIPNYPAFLFTGVLAWGWFSTAVLSVTGAIVSNAELMRQPGFPAALLPAVKVTTELIHFLLALPILFFLILTKDGALTAASLALPLIVAVQFALILGLGYLVATLHVGFRDTPYLLGLLLQLLYFLTPVFYDATAIPEDYQTLYWLNPMAHLIEAYRAVLLVGALPDHRSLATLILLTTALLFVGYATFQRAHHRFVDEL